jgi:hypothetical protein
MEDMVVLMLCSLNRGDGDVFGVVWYECGGGDDVVHRL